VGREREEGEGRGMKPAFIYFHDWFLKQYTERGIKGGM